MKKFICIALLIALLLTGCASTPGQENQVVKEPASPNGAPPATETETVSEPLPLEVLCIMDCPAMQESDFFKAAEEQAERYGWALTKAAQEDGYETALTVYHYDGILALRTKADTSLAPLDKAAQSGVEVALIDLTGALPSPGVSTAVYKEEDNMAEYVLTAALAFPPHDTPVRLIALLKQKGSAADQAYGKGIGEGKIFSRALHYDDNQELSLQDFIKKQLKKWIEGTLDAWYVEDIETAKVLMDLLQTENRTDAEVFVVDSGSMAMQKEMYRHWVFPMAIGADVYFEATQQAGALNGLFNGALPVMREFKTTMYFME